MPLENTLNASPYFDDFDQAKDYYKVLFKPGVSVQTRELNQLQTILQNQVEKFGDHIFKSGTILSGINFSYLPNYSYAKIVDSQIDGQPVLPSSYVDYFVKTDLNLTARVVNYADGLESKAPDLNTLYLQYTSSSDADTANSNTSYTTFSPGQILTVFSPDYPLFDVAVNNGGLGFANSDAITITSSIIVSGNTVAFSNGETLTSSAPGAPKVTVASINTTAIANTIVIQVRPRTVDLTNNSVNSTSWSLLAGYNVVGGSSGATANLVSFIGSGATGLMTTDAQGIIQNIILSNVGQDYTYLPTVTVKTTNTTATVSSLDLTPLNYKTKITVANAAVNAIGTGYAFGVSSGVIYQKGYFLKVDPQVILISKYDVAPDGIAVGFETTETVISAYADESLYDNAANTTNYAAPGADRLKLTPTLTVQTSTAVGANALFLSLAEWKEGQPFRENKTTVYSNIGEEMARRTRESQGNFVMNPFDVSSKELTTANTTHIQALIDPGAGYVSGYRVASDYNTYIDIPRANTKQTQLNRSITVNYGNYVLINELAGVFAFKAGAVVNLYDTAKQYVTNATIGSSTSITPAGSAIGTARMRSLILNSGDPGTASCTYRLYLFDIQMNAGYSFRNVHAVYYDNTEDGIADIVLSRDPSTGIDIAVLNDTLGDRMLFSAGQPAISTITNISHQYRTSSDTALQLTSSGQLAIGPLGTGLTFPYSDGVVSSIGERDFIIFPIANTQAAANATGTVTLSTTNTLAVGVGTSFLSDFKVGDFIKVNNTTTPSSNVVRQIIAIGNNTSMNLNSLPSVNITTNSAVIFYPAMYPLALESRADRSITITGSGKTATLNITKTLASTVNAIAVYSVLKTNAVPVTKTINRDLFVKIHTSNNTAGANGPWHLGVPGTARLKNVYLGSNTTVNTSSTDITKYFYIDVGDDENVYRSSRLVLSNKEALTLTANQFMLVQFDAFTTGGAEGFFTIDSYNIDDTANLASSAATINTLEIPETVTKKGAYYDLRDAIDFRPYATNTAVLSTTVAGASINPAGTFALSGDEQFFPTPDSAVTYDVTYYLPRKDAVAVDVNSEFSYVVGTPDQTPREPAVSDSMLYLGTMFVPPYPSLPTNLNAQTMRFASKQTGNDRGLVAGRISNYRMSTSYGALGNLQPRKYSMADIGIIDRRLQNVEYAINLNKIEQSIASQAIPSVVTPSINRFKNAFFVETFDDFSRSAITDREYACSIEAFNSVMKPLTQTLNFECKFDTTDATTAAAVVGNTLMLPYTEEMFVDQSVKSDIIGVDGHSVQFVGNISVYPASFSLLAQVTVIPDPPIVSTSAPGVPQNNGNGGDRAQSYGRDNSYGYADGSQAQSAAASGTVGGYGPGTAGFGGTPSPSGGDAGGSMGGPNGGGSGPTSGNGGGGGGGGGRVICTYFYRKGMISQAVWRADLTFTHKHLSPTTVRGYQYWGIPYVHLMRKSPLAEKIMYPIAKWRAEELAYQEGVLEKGNFKGKIVRAILEPICFAIGLFVGEQNWQSLWQTKG